MGWKARLAPLRVRLRRTRLAISVKPQEVHTAIPAGRVLSRTARDGAPLDRFGSPLGGSEAPQDDPDSLTRDPELIPDLLQGGPLLPAGKDKGIAFGIARADHGEESSRFQR